MAQRTINSPGVEIRESDLSLTAPANVGTNIYITGFAQQGPLDEVLSITTKQELVQVFGTPTNSAENPVITVSGRPSARNPVAENAS